MNDFQCSCFMAAAEVENFTKASEKLFITQPVLGRHIASLERELGFPLFIRERKSVKLSKYGRMFYDYLKRASTDFSLMLNDIHKDQRGERHSLIIGSSEGQMIGEVYAPVIEYLLKNHPEIDLKLMVYSFTSLENALYNGAVDIIIVSENVAAHKEDRIVYQKLQPVKIGLVVPENHPVLCKKDLNIRDFHNECFILVSPDYEYDDYIKMEETAELIGTDTFKIAPNITTLSMWMEAGIGITTLPFGHKLCFNPKFKFLEFEELSSVIEVAAWLTTNSNPCIPVFTNALTKTGFHL